MTASQDQDTAQSGPLSADAELVFVDCEMTGGNIDKNEIIEIGAVRVQLAADELRVSSESGSSPERFRNVASLIERIARCQDTELLYVERLNQLLGSPGSESSGLGLIRVAHEGAFVLGCSYDEPKLTITAVRKLA